LSRTVVDIEDIPATLENLDDAINVGAFHGWKLEDMGDGRDLAAKSAHASI
jgi:hypothetical protein